MATSHAPDVEELKALIKADNPTFKAANKTIVWAVRQLKSLGYLSATKLQHRKNWYGSEEAIGKLQKFLEPFGSVYKRNAHPQIKKCKNDNCTTIIPPMLAQYFIPSRPNMDYCSVKCRNYHNVNVHRRKESNDAKA